MHEISISSNIITLIFFTSTLLAIGVCLFFIGYFIGKQSSATGVSNTIEKKPKGFFDNVKNESIKSVKIDDTTIVTKINTENLEKKYDQLGEIKKSDESISDSIQKLKNLKR